MARNLVVCLDGTSNRFARDNTNVVKLFEVLLRDSAQQQAWYQTGIGTVVPAGIYGKLARRVVEELDMAFAILLEGHVLSAYRYLCQTWEPGDRIFIFGFSRGAFTARVLAGMVHKIGLLGRDNDELLPFAWDMFVQTRDPSLADGFRRTFGREVAIDFLGLWDTVSSVGWAYSPRHFPFTADNPGVRVVRHAMALDERRAYFPQNEWTHAPRPGQDVLQVWFAGVHCDVGGGYAESSSGLSKIAFKWLLGHAAAAGLDLHADRLAALLPASPTAGIAPPDPLAPLHESLRGWWWLIECLPKRTPDPARHGKRRWTLPLGRHRLVRDGALIHESVFERMDHPASHYRPANLPAKHARVA